MALLITYTQKLPMIKKIILSLAIIFFISFKTGEEKRYAVSLTLPEWQAVLNVIDQSNAPHSQVKAVQELLIPILNKQIDTTKKK